MHKPLRFTSLLIRSRKVDFVAGAELTMSNCDQHLQIDAEVTVITYIRTHEGWLYLTVVIDLYSRAVVGWSMNSTMATELVLDAMMIAVWRRRPKASVMNHSDQGTSSVVMTSTAGARTTNSCPA